MRLGVGKCEEKYIFWEIKNAGHDYSSPREP
jgi:hypothetical protein